MLQITCIGHLGSDAECKVANGKEFCTFRIAHTDRWVDDAQQVHEQTTWVDCIINGKPNVLAYLKKGQQVYVTGNCSLRIYSSPKDKCMKAGMTINVRQIELLGSKSDDIPTKLYTIDNNKEVTVTKHYYAADMKRAKNTDEYLPLISKSNGKYVVDRNGWVFRYTEPTGEDEK